MRLNAFILCLAFVTLSAHGETFVTTAYCNEGSNGCRICNGKWAALNRTASGRAPRAGVTCAAPRRIPFGTWVEIEGVGKRRVDDRLAKRFYDRFDVFCATHKEAKAFGVRRLDVKILTDGGAEKTELRPTAVRRHGADTGHGKNPTQQLSND